MKKIISIATIMILTLVSFNAVAQKTLINEDFFNSNAPDKMPTMDLPILAQEDYSEYEDLYIGYFRKANTEPKTAVTIPATTKVSYGGYFSLGGHLDLTQEDGLQFGGINFLTEQGFKVDFNNHRFFGGIGVGLKYSCGTGDYYDSDEGYVSIPAYLTLKYIHNTQNVSPVFGVKTGYIRYLESDIFEGSNATLLGANIGVRIPLNNVGLNINAEYQFHCFSWGEGINSVGINLSVDW